MSESLGSDEVGQHGTGSASFLGDMSTVDPEHLAADLALWSNVSHASASRRLLPRTGSPPMRRGRSPSPLMTPLTSGRPSVPVARSGSGRPRVSATAFLYFEKDKRATAGIPPDQVVLRGAPS